MGCFCSRSVSKQDLPTKNSWFTSTFLRSAKGICDEQIQILLSEIQTKDFKEPKETKESNHGHGIAHMQQVYDHTFAALMEHEHSELTDRDYICVLLAAYLHDVDDRKLFKTQNYQNARNILSKIAGLSPRDREFIIQMISWVSASSNKDQIPQELCYPGTQKLNPAQEWKLFPRYADRLEAIGEIGIERCRAYCAFVKLPNCVRSTIQVRTQDELWKVASEERYQKYNGVSASMIDHYYDKLLRCCQFPISNKYLQKIAKERRQPLIDFVLSFWHSTRDLTSLSKF
jgi:uncharacterized protein